MAEVIFRSALQLEAVAARRNEAHIVRDDVEMAQFLAMSGTTALVHGASEEHVRNRFPILKGKGLAIVPASQLLAM